MRLDTIKTHPAPWSGVSSVRQSRLFVMILSFFFPFACAFQGYRGGWACLSWRVGVFGHTHLQLKFSGLLCISLPDCFASPRSDLRAARYFLRSCFCSPANSTSSLLISSGVDVLLELQPHKRPASSPRTSATRLGPPLVLSPSRPARAPLCT